MHMTHSGCVKNWYQLKAIIVINVCCCCEVLLRLLSLNLVVCIICGPALCVLCFLCVYEAVIITGLQSRHRDTKRGKLREVALCERRLHMLAAVTSLRPAARTLFFPVSLSGLFLGRCSCFRDRYQ